MPVVSTPPLLGILVGGASSRMHGFPKGLLGSPRSGREGATLVEGLAAEFRAVVQHGEVVLVGRHAAYEPLGLPMIADEPPGIGPLGGLAALLSLGARRGAQVVLASCDLPHLDREVFAALLAPELVAPALAVARQGRLEPFPSRHDPARMLPAVERAIAAGQHSLRALLEGGAAGELVLSERLLAALDDWDRPEDLQR